MSTHEHEPVIEGYRFHVRFPLKWGEMDALGHVNNTVYFRFIEEARIAYFAALGQPVANAKGVGPILATATCDFRRPIVWPADIVVGTRVAKIGTTSLTLESAIATADRLGEPAAMASAVVVLLDYDTGKKVPVPEAMRARVAALESGAKWHT
jgi:acyl-CoA thioester hydrolase